MAKRHSTEMPDKWGIQREKRLNDERVGMNKTNNITLNSSTREIIVDDSEVRIERRRTSSGTHHFEFPHMVLAASFRIVNLTIVIFTAFASL